MGRAGKAMRRLMCLLGDEEERGLRRVLCSCLEWVGSRVGSRAARSPFWTLLKLVVSSALRNCLTKSSMCCVLGG